MNQREILYYDGACPLCRAEVSRLARLADTQLSLQDIHRLPSDAIDDMPDKTQLLARLHLRREDGTWLTGMAANIQAWQHTPFWWCWKLLDLPLVRFFSYGAYELWLRWRSRKQDRQCDDDHCQPRAPSPSPQLHSARTDKT